MRHDPPPLAIPQQSKPWLRPGAPTNGILIEPPQRLVPLRVVRPHQCAFCQRVRVWLRWPR